MNKLLLLILFILLLLIGRKRGFKTFITFIICMLQIFIYMFLMRIGLNSIFWAFISCVIASLFSIFFLNGYSKKTLSSFISVMIVQVIVFILVYVLCRRAGIGSFAEESLDTIGGYYFNIKYNMNNVLIGVLLVSVVGTVIDTSISVASAMNEVYENNKRIKDKDLYQSGMNVGGDILSTTINTLFFALISTSIGFFMWHRNMMIGDIINYKLFAEYVIQLLIAFIASIIIIPVTAYICSKMLASNKFNKVINVFDKIHKEFKEE